MPETTASDSTAIIEVLAIALSVALVAGILARAVRLPPIVGYLVAGALLSPHAPGYDGDIHTVQEVAELGVIFLMFGVGLKFNVRELLEVRSIVVPGAIAQITVATIIGAGVGLLFGLPMRESIVLGLALSIASTVVLVRVLEDRGLVESVHGRVAIGWLVVQDLATVIILAVLPSLGPDIEGNIVREAAISLGKAAVFLVAMLVVGTRVMPLALRYVGQYGSRELFVLAVVVAALGIAAGATLFGVSLALGAFIAGVAISETDTSTQAAADVVPLREAFAVLFFVGVGMLLDVGTVIDNADLFAAVLVLILLVNAIIAIIATSLTTYPARTGFIVAAGLSNVGEFSFIIVNEGLGLGIISDATYSVVLAASLVTIGLTRGTFMVHERLARRAAGLPMYRRRPGDAPALAAVEHMRDHVVVAGYGRVGQLLVHSLLSAGVPAIAIESSLGLARRANNGGIAAIWGDSANSEVLSQAHIETARLLVIAVPDESTTVLAIANARKLNPEIGVVARAHGREEMELYYRLGAHEVVVPEYEGGLELMERTLTSLGFDSKEALAFMHAQRDIHYGAVGHTSATHVHTPH